MKRFIISLVLVLASIGTNVAQSLEDKTIMTVNNIPVSVGEFLGVYQKNLELVTDQKQKELDNYLDLYVDYKLKVAEAYDRQIDTTSSFLREYDKYRRQAAESYLATTKVTDTIMREAFERSKEQLKVRHILVKVLPQDAPEDTLIAYNKIADYRNKIVNEGADFDIIARKYSEDPGVGDHGGMLNWFSVFGMVYPFESAAYNTPVGEVSEIVRTKYGYHILEVLERRVKADEVIAAHIMITPKEDDPNFNPETRINEIYASLKQGASFSELAEQFSDDKNTAVNGGKLKRFGPGGLTDENFENQVFALEKPEDYSKPFKTAYGWHIVKLIERFEYPSYDEVQQRLRTMVRQDKRLDYINNVTNVKLKEYYNVKSPEGIKPFFANFITDDILELKWNYTDSLNPDMKRVIFELPEATVTYHDFAKYLEERQSKSRKPKSRLLMVENNYNVFELVTLREYFVNHLDSENPEFAKVIKEYKEGLLIFDLMDDAIWDKVEKDSLGLREFYNANKNKYQYKERVEGIVATAPNKEVISAVRKDFKRGKTLEELKTKYGTAGKLAVIFSEGTYEVGARELPADLKIKKGVSAIYNKGTQYTVVLVNEVIPVTTKKLSAVRGRVMGDFQEALEASMIKDLKAKFPVKINYNVVEEVKQNF